MASLLDTIRNNMNTVQKQGASDDGAQIRKLLGAKSGKASASATPGIASSSLGASSAVDTANAGLQQVQDQGNLAATDAAQGQAGIQEQERQGMQDINLQDQAQQQKLQIQTDQLLGDLSRDRTQLNSDKGRAQLEQVAQNLALSDQKYVDELKRTGDMQRLQDDLSFEMELKKAAFADSTDILSDDLVEKAAAADDQRAFQESLAHTKLIDMIKKDKRDAEAAQKRAKYQAIGSIISGGTQMASSSSKKSE